MFTVKPLRKTVNKTIRVPVDLLAELDRVADSQGVSLNNLIVQCCEYALSDMPDTPKPSPAH